ncbi:MAG TPA: hypothetical protein VFD69_07475 [Vicinamibacterales bacterium]|nr:hypothetical protein [Vicinamibacterales bacterium]
MPYQLRRHLRVIAATVLVSVSAIGAWSTIAHGLECHDAECAPAVVAHDASAHAFRGAELPGGEREVHCVLCHWTRAFGPRVQSVSAAPSFVSRPLAVSVADASVARLIAADQPPLRAPPSAPTLAVVA